MYGTYLRASLPILLGTEVPPDAPTNLQAVAGNSQVVLTWDQGTGGVPTDYIVEYRVKV